jgi:hypothetical protein
MVEASGLVYGFCSRAASRVEWILLRGRKADAEEAANA